MTLLFFKKLKRTLLWFKMHRSDDEKDLLLAILIDVVPNVCVTLKMFLQLNIFNSL
jgi:hypothetical protein